MLRIHVSSESDKVLSRSATPEPNSLAVRVRVEEGGDIRVREFLTWRRTFGDNNAEERNRILTAVKSLPESWHQLDPADLWAAVSCAEPEDGRFFIYLPTDVPTGTAAHLNAPFYGDLSRTGIDFTLPINALFLDALREWLLDEIAPTLIGGSTQEAEALVDLLGQTGGTPPRIIEGKTARLSQMPLLLTQHGWAHAQDARPIPDLRSRYLDSNRLRTHATFKALDASLDSRLATASTLITMLAGRNRPLDSEIAATIERVALGARVSRSIGSNSAAMLSISFHGTLRRCVGAACCSSKMAHLSQAIPNRIRSACSFLLCARGQRRLRLISQHQRMFLKHFRVGSLSSRTGFLCGARSQMDARRGPPFVTTFRTIWSTTMVLNRSFDALCFRRCRRARWLSTALKQCDALKR